MQLLIDKHLLSMNLFLKKIKKNYKDKVIEDLEMLYLVKSENF